MYLFKIGWVDLLKKFQLKFSKTIPSYIKRKEIINELYKEFFWGYSSDGVRI